MYHRLGLVLAVVASGALGVAEAQVNRQVNASMLTNESFETGGAAQDSLTIVVPPGWVVTGSATQVEFGASGMFPTIPQEGDLHFLAGGPESSVSSVSQAFVLTDWIPAAVIDTGSILFSFGALLGGAANEADESAGEIQLADSLGVVLSSARLGPVTAADRGNVTTLLRRFAGGVVPSGTRRISCAITMSRADGSYNNAYCDGVHVEFAIPDAVVPMTWSDAKARYRWTR